jgi:DNA helicase-2/ATP-dependent DNA helicase PcrA
MFDSPIILYTEKGTANCGTYYIGKVGVMDEESNRPIVLDWRAPLSSLFYSFSDGDNASYEAPEGVVEGELHLKRNTVIRNQQLIRVVDSYVKGETDQTGTDEFLLYQLGERKDHRLRDIVSSIQAEQNAIIRSPKDTAIIIQGVAGSGKTTVALHRLAYLLYQYQKQLKPERMIIFAPNPMFLDYISEVLPELGVGDVQQSTFVDWALHHLEEEVELAEVTARQRRGFESTASTETTEQYVTRYKGSIAFMTLIQSYLTRIEEESVPTRDFSPWDGCILSAETMRHWYQMEYRSYPLMRRRERILNRMKSWVEGKLKSLESDQQKREYRKKQTSVCAPSPKSGSLNPPWVYTGNFFTRPNGHLVHGANSAYKSRNRSGRRPFPYLSKNASPTKIAPPCC